MASLTEDDIYRTSTQYRLWAFSKDSLTSLRSTTNSLAIENVQAAIRSSRISNGHGDTNDKEVECLTVDEEQRLVGYYCVRAMQLADFCDFPTNVKVGGDMSWRLSVESLDTNRAPRPLRCNT